MFPKFICVFTHRHGRGWHGDWAGKSKWGFRGFLTTHVPPVRFLERDGYEILEFSPHQEIVLCWGL